MGKPDNFLRKFFSRAFVNVKSHGNSLKSPYFVFLSIFSLALVIFAYSNHFSNSFQFDDSHTIENNAAIKEVDIQRFFTDATTFSSLNTNQSYRPFTTLENAIDYQLAGGLNSKIFHIHIFLWFLLVCVAIFFLVKIILDKLNFSKFNQFWGLLNAAIFGILCVNAETVNYIIQRSEITSAFFVLAGLVAILSGGIWRKYLLYLIFPFIGFFTKEMALVFAPLLLLYFLIFEEQVYLLHFYKKNEFKKCVKSFKKTLPAILLTIAFYVLYSKMRPDTFFPGGPSQFKYLITQPMVMCHYVLTYFVPYNLSADTDWQVFESLSDYRVIVGIILVLALFYLALKASNKKELRFFSFGILWFFISLLPTSSFIPFSEVLNDHRTFIPYIGLTMAFVFGTKYLFQNILQINFKTSISKTILGTALFLFIGANIYGVRERNEVWRSKLTLWADVAKKSPKNGRGLMNYGLALMKKGDYSEAEKYFLKALEVVPNYSTLHVNLGVLNNALGKNSIADNYYKKALELNQSNHVTRYFYAKFLVDNDRNVEAINHLKQAVTISPNYEKAVNLLMATYHKTEDWDNLKKLTQQIINDSPKNKTAKKYLDFATGKKSEIVLLEENIKLSPTPEKYLDLSLKYFKSKKYQQTIAAAQEAIKLKADYAEAYNNIGIAYYEMSDYEQSIEAYERSIILDPEFQLAKNNMANAVSARENAKNLKQKFSTLKTADDFLNYSLECYKLKKFVECIEAVKKSIAIKPTANAYNNMCAAYNQLSQYDKAIESCKKALKIDGGHKLAQGNLDFAISQTKLP